MMLPTCFPIEEDELFEGWLHAIAEAMGMPFSKFAKCYLGPIGNLKHRPYVSNLDWIVGQYYGVNHFFPDIYEIIKSHTDFLTARLCLSNGGAAKTIEYMLRENYQALRNFHVDKYNTCPLCQEEDKRRFGRSIIHVSHQIRGVKVCYKHGTPFKDDPTLNLDTEWLIARFAYELFKSAVDVTLADYAKFVTTSTIHDAVAAGYIGDQEGKRLLRIASKLGGDFTDSAIRFFAWYFSGNVQELCQNGQEREHWKSNDELFSMVRSEYGIGEYVCKTCDKVFHMANRADEAGAVCPWCKSGMTEQEQMERIVSRYGDGHYEYLNGKLRHTLCGFESVARNMFWLNTVTQCAGCHGMKGLSAWSSALKNTEFETIGMVKKSNENYVHQWVRLRHKPCGCEFEIMSKAVLRREVDRICCPVCHGQKITKVQSKRYDHCFEKNKWDKRIGERRVNMNGVGFEIIDYEKRKNGYIVAVVRLDNGLVRKMAWDTFNRIDPFVCSRIPESYIGMEKTMRDGRVGIIVAYKDHDHLSVAFSDGAQVQGSMRQFRKGLIGCSPRSAKK